jgi:hypothetical protein
MKSACLAACKAVAGSLALLATTSMGLAENDRMEGNVITYVCRVDTTFRTKSGDTFTSTSCIDGKYNCNDVPGRGFCAATSGRSVVTKSCAWVALSMCRSG